MSVSLVWQYLSSKRPAGISFAGMTLTMVLSLSLSLLGCSTPAPTYVGTATCASCHTSEAAAWESSDHKWAMQLPDSTTVRAAFDGEVFDHQGERFEYIRSTEGQSSGAAGLSVIARRDTFDIQYAFGHYPLQQYLIEGERGRLQALTTVWDVDKEEWYSLYPDQATPPGHPLDWQGDNLNWNYMCASCHTTGLNRGYDVESDAYKTTWAEGTVGCEACHGPGSNHVDATDESYGTTGASDGVRPTSGRADDLVLQSELAMCASCHSRRMPLVEPVPHGEDFLDLFAPRLVEDELYYDDGQILDEVYVYGSFMQSRMAQVGMTCSDCHEPHTGLRRLEGNVLCMSCHVGKVESIPVHIEHNTETVDVSCETCHMPKRTYMGIDERGDHRFAIPDPVTSRAIGSPSVCSDCHGEDQNIESILATPSSRPGLAVLALRAGMTDAVGQVKEVLIDSTVSRFTKGSMIARLGQRREAGASGTDALRIMMTALSSGNPFERVGALRGFAGPGFGGPLPNLTNVFADELRWVRVEAVATALAHGINDFSEEPARSALMDYIKAQETAAERAESHLNLAGMHEVLGQMDLASKAYERAERLEPSSPEVLMAHGTFLGRWAAAVAQSDVSVWRTRRIDAEQRLRAATVLLGADAAEALFILGLYLGEERPRLPSAAEALEESYRLDPSNVRAVFNAGAARQQIGELHEAERLYLLGLDDHPGNADLRDAMVTLYIQTQRWEQASEWNQAMRRDFPGRSELLERQAWIQQRLE